jgi:hypothetical protein
MAGFFVFCRGLFELFFIVPISLRHC